MKPGDNVYLVVQTWDSYSDYREQVIYVTDSRNQAISVAKDQQLIANSQCIAKAITDDYSDNLINEDSSIRLRIYPFEKVTMDKTEAERKAYDLDDDHDIQLYAGREVSGGVNGQKINCYLLLPTGRN